MNLYDGFVLFHHLVHVLMHLWMLINTPIFIHVHFFFLFNAIHMYAWLNVAPKSYKPSLMLTVRLHQVADFDDLEEDKFLNAVVKVGFKNTCPWLLMMLTFPVAYVSSRYIYVCAKYCFVIFVLQLPFQYIMSSTVLWFAQRSCSVE